MRVWTPGSGGGGPSGPSGWTSVVDVDFSAQPNQTLSPDGNYTIGGTVFTKVNSSGDAVPMAIVHGQGLVIQPVAATDYFSGTFSLPGLRWNLGQIPNYYLTLPIRAWFHLTAGNFLANFDAATAGIEATNTGTPALDTLMKRAFDGGQVWLAATNVNGSNLAQVIDHQFLTDDVLITECPDGLPFSVTRMWTGVFGSTWPSFTNCNGHSIQQTDAADSISLDTAAGPFQPILPGGGSSGWNAFMGASRSGSGTALSVTFARMKVEVHLP